MILNENNQSNSIRNESEQEDKNDGQIYLRKIGGFDLLYDRPMISKNGNCLLVIYGTNIRKYHVNNGNFIGEYYFGSDKKIVSIFHGENDNEAYVGLEDGRIIQWNYVDNYKITDSFVTIDYPNMQVLYIRKVDNIYYMVINKPKKHRTKSQLYYCVQNEPNKIKLFNDKVFVEDFYPKSIAFGPQSKIEFCAVISKHQLYVFEIPFNRSHRYRSHFINTEKKFTTVAFHPFEQVIATGDINGQIFIWNDIFSISPSKSILHWHSSSVADLTFVPSGTRLFSVGDEMVLVKWNLVGQHFGQKDFMPRIGAKIKFVTVDSKNTFAITSHFDQCLHILDTQMNGIRAVIEGLSLGCGKDGKLSTGLHNYSRLNALALNGRVGHIQFYCPSNQKQLFQFDVVQQNLINTVPIGRQKQLKNQNETNEWKFFPIEVTKMAMSEDGLWFATVEYRNDHETSPEIRLKFWLSKKENNGFSLNTTIHLPHNDEIIFMEFSTQTERKTFHLVTTSKDKTFKIWDLNTNDNNKWWNCSRSGSLNNHSIPIMASFSSDVSLLSVLFENVVTLWELDLPSSIRYIPRMDIFDLSHDKKVIFLSFAYGKFSHYLIEARMDSVIVRNAIKKFEKVFTYKPEFYKIYSITLNKSENILALINPKRICFLSLQTENIVAKIDLTSMKYFCGPIISSLFAQSSSLQFNGPMFKNAFYCINGKNELFEAIYSSNGQCNNDSSANLVGFQKDKEAEQFIKRMNSDHLTPLSLMKSHQQSSSKHSNDHRIDSEKLARTLVDNYFMDVPTHVLPPVDLIEKKFLSSYLECLNLNPNDNRNQTTDHKSQTNKKDKIAAADKTN